MSEDRGFALITGASRGIGRAIALHLADDGYDVAFCYRQDLEAARQVEAEALSRGRYVFHQPCDVADFQAVQAFVKACEEHFGTLEVLVNCAGIIRDNPLVLMGKEDWQSVMDTNLSGCFHFCRSAVFGFLKRKRGVIVNISSVSGVYGNPRQSNYSAAKAGIIGFSKSLAKELAPYNIRVNVVAPGYIQTDMTASVSPKVLEKVLQSIPMGRIGEPEDVAELVSFLVSNRAKYITGQTFQVDGGITL
ncbi:MAG: 3-oxoacyl-[acyl-carrier-protein] reductase [Chloroflexi bacterium]|nr:3-oxoacyl-[acyl-carrier-protein] reductase [Chloroflexota bacterium]